MYLADLNLPTFTRPGICEGAEDPDLWHSNKRLEQQEAKRICGLCPVRSECLQWALDNSETSGIWGGLTPGERKALLRDRRRGIVPRDETPPISARYVHKRPPAGFCECGAAAHSKGALYCDVHVHGTPAGRSYHLKHGQDNCDECKKYIAAERNTIRIKRQRRAAKRTAA